MNLEDFRSSVNSGIEEYFNNQIKLAPSNEALVLLKRIKIVSKAGKRFRPSLFFLTYKAYGGKDTVNNLSIALELLHQALMIHDDLIDEDTKRHGKNNITGFYMSELTKDTSVPQAMSLLAGDLLLTHIYQFILEAQNLNDKTKIQIISLFQTAITAAIYGQQLDALNVDSLSKALNESQLQKINRFKTTSYSTLLPLNLAGLLLNLSEDEAKKLNFFGLSLGYYAQLINDYQNYFKINKADDNLGDFSHGKLTVPYAIAKKLCSPAELKVLNSLSNKKRLSTAETNKVISILRDSGVDKSCENLIEQYYSTSVRNLKLLSISDKDQDSLLALIDSIRV